MKKVVAYYISIAIALFLIALGIYEDDTVVATYAAIAAVLYAVLLYCCRSGVIDPRPVLVSAAMLLVMSLIMLYVLNFTGEIYSSYGIGPDGELECVFSKDKEVYAHIEGIAAWLISYPMAYVATMAIAVMFGSRLNRFLIGGFLVFNSEAFTSLMLVAISLFNKDQLGESFFFVDELAYLFTGLVLSLIAAVFIVHYLKGKGFVFCRESTEVSA